MNKPVMITDDLANRLKSMLKQWELRGRVQPEVVRTRNWQVVECTSATANSTGYYDAVVVSLDPEEGTDEQGTVCNLWVIDGAPEAGSKYLAMQVHESIGSRALFATVPKDEGATVAEAGYVQFLSQEKSLLYPNLYAGEHAVFTFNASGVPTATRKLVWVYYVNNRIPTLRVAYDAQIAYDQQKLNNNYIYTTDGTGHCCDDIDDDEDCADANDCYNPFLKACTCCYPECCVEQGYLCWNHTFQWCTDDVNDCYDSFACTDTLPSIGSGLYFDGSAVLDELGNAITFSTGSGFNTGPDVLSCTTHANGSFFNTCQEVASFMILTEWCIDGVYSVTLELNSETKCAASITVDYDSTLGKWVGTLIWRDAGDAYDCLCDGQRILVTFAP